MRDFLKYTLATLTGIVLFFLLGAASLTALLIAIAVSSREVAPAVENDSILTLDLSQSIIDSSASANPSNLIGEALSGGERSSAIPLRTVLETVTQAAKDDRIAGLYLYGNINSVGSGSGYATLREVRQVLQAFRDAGKPIYAYDNLGWTERDYYLTSVANTILLNPSGLLEFNGLSTETTFFAGALQKYGIGIQSIRAGRYKSAVEPFTRTSGSPEAREESQKLLTDLWNEFLTAVAKSRSLTPQQLQAIADKQALLLPDQAKSARLVDQLAYEDEVVTALRKLTKEKSNKDGHSFRQLSLSEYANAIKLDTHRKSQNRIAVIYAEGDIVTGSSRPGSVGGDDLAGLLRELRQQEDVKAVVLRVNSPGGSASASAMVAREVALISKAKPTIVSMGSYAASGGYQISTYANRIFASPNTITGSIGVFGLLPNVQEIANKNGITWEVTKTGRLADLDTISRPKTPQELAISQRVVDRLYDQFLNSVAASRSMPRQEVAAIAQGRVWSGAEAKKIGLVDDLGGLEDAIQAAAKQANLGNDWALEEYPRYRSFEARLIQQLFGSRLAQIVPFAQLLPAQSPQDPLSLELQKLQADLNILRSMNDPQGAYTRLPFSLRVE